MSFPDMKQRKACWTARDNYWKCLDEKAPEFSTSSGEESPAVCQQFRKLFQETCPGQWITHFDRKRTYEQFKERMAQGLDPLQTQK